MVNKAIIIGNLGADPELKYAGSNPVCELRVATTDKWTSKDGEKKEQTEWHRVVVWGKTAEHCKTYLRKGRQVYVEGRIRTRQWEDKEGQKRYTTEIIADKVQFIGGGERREGQGASQASLPGHEPSADTRPDDDIPF